jgi:YD repeat-containing protein
MYVPSILLVALIGGTFVVSAALLPLSSDREKGWRRWLTTAASCILVVGAAGFFGSALSAAGGLNWLPNSFEWPVGYASGVISTPAGLHVVPHTPSGRIQVYEADWSCRTGWHVGAGGGTFKISVPAEGRIEAITARGQWHYVFDAAGRLISKNTYQPKSYGDFPEDGESLVVRTATWLWVFRSRLFRGP